MKVFPVFNYYSEYFLLFLGIFKIKNHFVKLKLDKRIIFANMEINTNFFGKLTILPDNKVYSSVYYKALGTTIDKLYDLIYNELTQEKVWQSTRNKIKPCKNCRYRFLCPPVSNYELATGKNKRSIVPIV